MDGELNLDNLLSDEQIAELGLGEPEVPEQETPPENENKENEFVDTEGLTASDLFGSEEPEKVGDEDNENTENKKKPKSTEAKETSPDNLYSSIAEAMVDEGFFSDFQDEVKECKSAVDLIELVKKQAQSQLDETQKRVNEALENGVQPSEISKAERTLKYLKSITNEHINDDSDNGVHLREQLIYNDYLSKGFSDKKARELTKRAFDAETDKEDAQEALESYKNTIQGNYDKLLNDAREAKKKIEEEDIKRRNTLKEKILNDKKAFGDTELNQSTRQRIYDVATKPHRKDKESGEYLTELELFEQEHPLEFLMNVAYYYAITDGFKNNEKITKAAEKKVTKAGLKKLEQVINGTQRNSDGSLRFISDRDNSYFDGDVSIDL